MPTKPSVKPLSVEDSKKYTVENLSAFSYPLDIYNSEGELESMTLTGGSVVISHGLTPKMLAMQSQGQIACRLD